MKTSEERMKTTARRNNAWRDARNWEHGCPPHRLKRIRELCGITQRVMAARMGVSEDVYWRWENGKDKCLLTTPQVVQRIAPLDEKLRNLTKGTTP